MKKLAVILAIAGLILAGTTQADILKVGPGQTYPHIQNAVAVANPYDVIEVYADTYTRTVPSSGVSVVKVETNNLTIMGMGSGTKEVYVTYDGGNNTGFAVLADDVTISGFTVTYNTPEMEGAGIGFALLPDTSNAMISDNEIYNFAYGVKFEGYGGLSGHSIVGNTLQDNWRGIALWGEGIDDVLIQGNTLQNTYYGVSIRREYVGDITNVTVQDNTFTDNGYWAIDVSEMQPGGYGTIENIIITGNDITGPGGIVAGRAYDGAWVADTQENVNAVHINYNNILDGTTYGLVKNYVEEAALDALCNWWGDPSGPNPTYIVGNVDVSTWLDGPYPGGVCIPEPGTMGLLGLGGLAILIRWRRRRA